MAEAGARGLRAVEGGSSVHPGGSGLQFAEELRKADRRVAVFVLTISLGADDHCRAPELDTDAVLSKATALDDITDARRRLRLSSDPESVVSDKRGQPPPTECATSPYRRGILGSTPALSVSLCESRYR